MEEIGTSSLWGVLGLSNLLFFSDYMALSRILTCAYVVGTGPLGRGGA